MNHLTKSFLFLLIGTILIASVSAADYIFFNKDNTSILLSDKEDYNTLVKLDEVKKVDDIKKDVSKEYTDLKAEYTAKQLEKTTVLKTELEKQKCYTLTTDKDNNLVLEISPEGDICSSEKEWAKFFESKEWKEWSGQ